jgi:hypothetical protein
MAKATEPKPDKPVGEGGGKRGSTKSKLTIHEEKTVKADTPAGSRFKATPASWFRIWWSARMSPISAVERWQTPGGKVVTASLPADIDGHFGPELRRFVLALSHQGQMTVSRLVTLLRSLGIFISLRQLVRLPNTGKDEFLARPVTCFKTASRASSFGTRSAMQQPVCCCAVAARCKNGERATLVPRGHQHGFRELVDKDRLLPALAKHSRRDT